MTQEQQSNLIQLLYTAHYNAALNNQGNISTVTFLTAYQGSKNIYQSIAAGILSMGHTHAPIDAARSLVQRYRQDKVQAEKSVLYLLSHKIKVPGFGNSFFKTSVDPSFQPAYDLYTEIMGLYNPIEGLSEIINGYFRNKGRNKGRKLFLYPNAAIITAAIAELCELPNGQEVAIALQGRMSAWVKLMNDSVN